VIVKTVPAIEYTEIKANILVNWKKRNSMDWVSSWIKMASFHLEYGERVK
jgi:hypothetical protein